MKQFSLEEYLADPSREIITRDGRKVRRILCTDARSEYPVIALVEDHEGAKDKALSFTKDGKSFSETDDVTDLFFAPGAPKKHQAWMNLYKHEWGYGLGNMFSDKKTAEASIYGKYIHGGDYIATVKIEWEE